MYPGTPCAPGIRHEFIPGLHLVAGVNGLGKSTFLLMLYHGLAGPAAIRNDDFGVAKPELAPRRHADRFSRRVADGAKSASVKVEFSLGTDRYGVRRSLHDLSLLSFTINDVEQTLDEGAYRRLISNSMKVAGFADVITILHLIVFMFEDRGLLMWNPSAQRNALRALFMSPSDADELATRTQVVATANSAYRNLLFMFNRDRKQIEKDKGKLEVADAHSAEYRTLQRAISGIDERVDNLSNLRRRLDDERMLSRQAHETAKHNFDELLREIEALKLARVAHAFPGSDDSSLYVLTRLIGDEECLSCGSDGGPLVERWIAAIAKDACVLCGAEHTSHEIVVPHVLVDAARLEKTQKRLDSARQALATASEDADAIAAQHDVVQKEIDEAIQEKSQLEKRVRQIAGMVPPSAHSLNEREQRLATQRETLEQLRIEQREAERSFSQIFDPFRNSIEGKADFIRERFAERISEFLVERAEISLGYIKAPIGESGQSYEWPTFHLSMTSGAFGAPAPRRSRSEVSMSQGEFIDLAFRLALVEAAVPSGAASMVFDAPEASLDALFMRRAGAFLAKFTHDNPRNRLIVTSNLTNADMIPALFGAYLPQEGDPEPRTIPRSERRERVIDLLSLAAPTSAVELVGGRYRTLLDKALFPPGGDMEPGL